MKPDLKENKHSTYVKPQIRISEHAYDSLIAEMTIRKLDNLSLLIERLAVDLEMRRK
jgi:hypothetical protein